MKGIHGHGPPTSPRLLSSTVMAGQTAPPNPGGINVDIFIVDQNAISTAAGIGDVT